jgi:hypothetical protein
MKETRWVIRGIRLSALRDFIDHVVADAANDLRSIEERRLAGEFETFEDYEHIESLPFTRIEIASRAVWQELANFVESELHAVAQVPWLESSHKGPKTLMEVGQNEQPSELRMVSDLGIRKVIGLIDRHYGISVEKLEGWDAVTRLRDAVNTFKHRDGIKHWRDSASGEKGLRFPQFEEITARQAYDAMETVKRFLLALDKATENSD